MGETAGWQVVFLGLAVPVEGFGIRARV